MRIRYDGRQVEIVEYEIYDGVYVVIKANYIDFDMRDLTEAEMIDLEENYFDSMSEARPKGNGY
jgi:hypothetical protein